MKRLILALSTVVFTVGAAFAQDNLKPSTIPGKGNFMVEINAHPFSEAGVFSIDRLQMKYWTGDKFLLRLGLEYDGKKNSAKESDYPAEERLKDTFLEKSNLFGLHAGFEYRILGKSKISPYVGLELSYRTKSSSSKYEDHDIDDFFGFVTVVDEIKNGWRYTETFYVPNRGYTTVYHYDGERAFNEFSCNLLLGTDFYFVKNMYFGFEIGLGYNKTAYKDIVYYNDIRSEHHIQIEGGTIAAPEKKNEFRFFSNSSIRFGVWF